MLISSRPRLEETLEVILQMALEVIEAHYGIFRLVDKSGRNLITRAVAGEQLARSKVEALPIESASVMGWVACHHQPVCIHDLRAQPWSQIYYPLDADLEMRSELAVPLIGASGRLEGVLNLENPVKFWKSDRLFKFEDRRERKHRLDGYRLLANTYAEGIPTIVVTGVASATDIEYAYAEQHIFACLEKQLFDRQAFLQVVEEARKAGETNSELGLTFREREVLALLVQGLTNQEMADKLAISINTVKRHLKAIYKKLGVHTRSAAVAKAVSAGIAAERVSS